MKILVIDNYDSFTFNLVQLIGRFNKGVIVKRNDRITIDEILSMAPDKIVISPGPGRPENSNVSLEVISELGKNTPVLGVCLGHQAIGLTFGCKIISAPTLMHGKSSNIKHDGKALYKNVEQNFKAGRYHSLVVQKHNIPDVLEISALTENESTIMGVRHKNFPIEGIQFHPESILTPIGEKLLKNWLEQ